MDLFDRRSTRIEMKNANGSFQSVVFNKKLKQAKEKNQ